MRFQDILNEQRFQYVVDGYGYNEEEDVESDGNNSKKWHYMTTPKGERITLNHSPYQWMDKDEFAVHVERHKELSEAGSAKPRDFRMKRPQLSIPPTQQELEQAFQRLSSMCDSYETMIEMQQEQTEKTFIAGYFAGHEDAGHGQDDEYAAFSDWQKKR